MPDSKMLTRPKAAQTSTSPGAALYVDTENLRDADHARQVVEQVVANWPGDRPPLGSLSLYVRADKAELWRLWAEDAFPPLGLRVRGVQHFSANNSKNSADLAIAADAVSDLVTGRANDLAVVSNDSDFAALFVKVRELAQEANAETVPFLWIHPPDGGALSPEIKQFIPVAFRWDLADAPPLPTPTVPAPAPVVSRPTPKSLPEATRPALPATHADASASNDVIADELIRRLPIGKFKVADAHDIFQDKWPAHPAATGPAQLGTFLLKEIWPIMQRHGVVMAKEKSPRTYEITPEAKDTVGKSTATADQSAKATPEQLAAAVAQGIADDIFKASDAQDALKGSRPQHPAASYTATQFGTWFARQLWPIMEQHGVTIAKEKPRRYEMTPDARHNLLSLA